MPVDINQLIEGWLELESDPGLFTLLLEDFGVKGVQVEEIYDLQKSIENPVYGFIFLFRWTEERRSRRKVVDKGNAFVKDEELVNNLFFAQQMVPNSCATHALLSVLLNCTKIHLGDTLARLKNHTSGMSPENKGWAIGNTPELAKAHNSHAMPQARRRSDKTAAISTGRCVGDAYHFVSYVPINGMLFELDGLKPYPIDHGPWAENEDWTEKFRAVIKDRLRVATEEGNNDICYNLMAVVPDKRLSLTHKLNLLRTNRQIVLDALQQLVQNNSSSSSDESEQKSPNNRRNLSSSLKENKLGDTADSSLKKLNNLLSPNTSNTLNIKDVLRDDDSKLKITSNHSENSKLPIMITSKSPDLKHADYFVPISIQDSSQSSINTDNCESGSMYNSAAQSKGFNKFVVIRVAMGNNGEDSKSKDVKNVCLEAGALPVGWDKSAGLRVPNIRISPLMLEKKSEDNGNKKLETAHHTFSPKDLLALVKNLEVEISHCEGLLRDENEKRKQYKIDDCRRTHNYDQFICTFLSMLAQQGKLADLVQQHLSGQRKQPNVISAAPPVRITSINKNKHSTNNKKQRGRTKNRARF